MSRYIPKALKQQVRIADRGRCCYCLTAEWISGIILAFDHIYPRSQGGQTCFENVCLACRSCNEFKSNSITAIDPLTKQKVALFHPRQQAWSDHFTWNTAGTHIIGFTACGRATIVALQMNNTAILVARKRWVTVGWHPPTD